MRTNELVQYASLLHPTSVSRFPLPAFPETSIAGNAMKGIRKPLGVIALNPRSAKSRRLWERAPAREWGLADGRHKRRNCKRQRSHGADREQ